MPKTASLDASPAVPVPDAALAELRETAVGKRFGVRSASEHLEIDEDGGKVYVLRLELGNGKAKR